MKSFTPHLATLFHRVAETHPDIFDILDENNDFTKAYVLAKTKHPLSEEQAWEMYERNKGEQKIGLLIWCFGEMKLWNVLVGIAQENEMDGS